MPTCALHLTAGSLHTNPDANMRARPSPGHAFPPPPPATAGCVAGRYSVAHTTVRTTAELIQSQMGILRAAVDREDWTPLAPSLSYSECH